jgi:NAD(P)-dependent dehydrogenase (short-subunit alcohol dehydrogenase family)
MDTHYFGTVNVIRALAPQLALRPESAILNVLSVLSWLSPPALGAYGAAKSAEWSMTNGLRHELAAQGTAVTALRVGYMDTDMTRGLDAPKHDAAEGARFALDGLAAGRIELLADTIIQQVIAGLAGGVGARYPVFA